MAYTILDCYTDEPAGLGVPPYLGTYPRYIFGKLLLEDEKVNYITIDDLRYYNSGFKKDESAKKKSLKTNIRIYNLTKTDEEIKKIIQNTSVLIVILGVHTPGKYLSAIPGTLHEVLPLIERINCKKVLTGPAVYGTQLEGGKFFERADLSAFDKIENPDLSYGEIKEYAVKGAEILNLINDLRVIEIETSRGCQRKKGCSFCLEPIKHKLEFREKKDIVDEANSLYSMGARHFRLGKQSCIYSYPELVELLREIRASCKELKVLHIDNANPINVLNDQNNEKTKAIVRYSTEGNIAAFGIESFDKAVYEENNLNCTAEQAIEAVRIINKYGAKRGENGMPIFLPGINLIFGLKAETKKTHEENIKWLKKILEESLLIRRINIRQASIFEGTELLSSAGNKFIRKNKRYYWKWRNEIRQSIDYEMLKRLLPVGSILKDVRMEIYEGSTTFGRQVGTYPLIIGVKERLELKKFYNVEIASHMLRSATAKVI